MIMINVFLFLVIAFVALFSPIMAAFIFIFIYGGVILWIFVELSAKKREKLRIKRKNIYRNKGLLVREFPNDYTVVYIKTTGYIPGVDKIFEIAAIKYRDNNIVDTFSSLVKVDFVPYDIKKLMGINDKMLKEAPTIDIVIKKFYDFVGSDILVCYDADFDIDFLYDNLFAITEIELENNFIDIMRIAKRVLKWAKESLGEYNKEAVAKYYNISIGNFHRALDDCKTCSIIYDKLKKDITKKYGSLENFYKKKKIVDN